MSIDVRRMTPLLEVFDMPTSLAFYRDLLGFEVVGRSGPDDNSDWVLLRQNDIHLMLNTAYESDERPPAPDPLRVRTHHDTALFFSCPDVDSAFRYLQERGVRAEPPKNAPYGMRQLYFMDPDGFSICFQWPVENDSDKES
jgi:glyoxylase I family protein